MVCLATSDDPRDAVLTEIAESEGALAFRGSADDKLLRYRDAARTHGIDFVVIVDGDDPFISISHIDRIIDHAASNAGDFIMFDNLPLGATGFGLRVSALEQVCGSRPESDTEVWGSLFTEDPAYTCVSLSESDILLARPEVRMTLDYPEDYEFFSTIVAHKAAEDVTFEWVMEYLADHPEIVEINRDIQAAFEAHLKKSSPNNE
jgi:spore coat polysaccharide biosynthesis protein SpsF (cytidylyltransferase family)